MTPTEEQRGFDLKRIKADLGDIGDPRFCDCEVRTQLAAAIAEIARLRASLIDLHAEYINTLEKNPECSAWDLDEQSDADQKRLRRNAAHAISIVEPPIYLQAEQRATKIKELEDELVKERTGAIRCESYNHCEGMYEIDLPNAIIRAQTELQAEGKIGPDADAKLHCWQITEERKAAIRDAEIALRDAVLDSNDPHCWDAETAVLRGMLEEVA